MEGGGIGGYVILIAGWNKSGVEFSNGCNGLHVSYYQQEENKVWLLLAQMEKDPRPQITKTYSS
jgi:hypothetical protein